MKDQFMLCRGGLLVLGLILLVKSIFFVFLGEERPDFPMIALIVSALPALFLIISGLLVTNFFRKLTMGVMALFLLLSVGALIQTKQFAGGLLINCFIFALPIFILTREAYKFYCIK